MTDDTASDSPSNSAAAESEPAPQSGGTEQGGSAAAPQTMGKMIIPDLSPLTTGQSENLQVMTSVTKEASQSLQKIVTAQQSLLEATIKNLQNSIQSSSGTAGIPSKAIPDLQAQVENLTLTVDNFCTSAETLTNSTLKSFETLNQSVNQSLAKIEEVATKFSGG